eukprot:1181671-Prorocentrum_minimum.AAC.3
MEKTKTASRTAVSRLQQVAELGHHVKVGVRHRLLQLLGDLVVLDALQDKLHRGLHVLLHEGGEDAALLLVGAAVAPRLDEGLEAEVLGVHVHHAAPRDGRGGGVLQVRHLEQELAVVRHADALRVGQGEQLVVVHHAVHVLHPHRVHVTVQHDPPPLLLVRVRQRLVHL